MKAFTVGMWVVGDPPYRAIQVTAASREEAIDIAMVQFTEAGWAPRVDTTPLCCLNVTDEEWEERIEALTKKRH
jgi:hypothetical protein